MIIRIIRAVFFEKWFFYRNLIKPLEAELTEESSILELGAGKSTYLNKIKSREYNITALDINQASLDIAKENDVYSDYLLGDVSDLYNQFEEDSFDAVVAFDLIEHLSKEEGFRLINNMYRIAKKKIVIFTPNGFQEQIPFDHNPFQEHISGWSYQEMKTMGFRVIGVNGYKGLRGMFSRPIIIPVILGNFISNLSWLLLKVLRFDRHSYAIMCFKDV